MDNITQLSGLFPTDDDLFELIKTNSVSEIRNMLKENEILLETHRDFFRDIPEEDLGWQNRCYSDRYQHHTLLSYACSYSSVEVVKMLVLEFNLKNQNDLNLESFWEDSFTTCEKNCFRSRFSDFAHKYLPWLTHDHSGNIYRQHRKGEKHLRELP